MSVKPYFFAERRLGRLISNVIEYMSIQEAGLADRRVTALRA